jgi:hypothetical protein
MAIVTQMSADGSRVMGHMLMFVIPHGELSTD